MTDTGIVTPEAVVLAFDTAGLGSRIIAKVIDLLIQAVALVVVFVASAAVGNTPVGLAGVYFGLFIVLFGYPVAIETIWRGKSVGKAAMGLRVVTIEGAPIRFRHALIRGAFSIIDLYATSGALAVFTVLATKRNQRLGDLVAGTLVLRERTGAAAPSAATFWVPRGWEGYAATLDVSGLTPTEYQAVRSFLLRAPTLDPWTRDHVARDLASPITRRLRHNPPPGVPAEGFLACVAALYQQRQRRAAPPPGYRPPPGYAATTGYAGPTGAPPGYAGPAGPVATSPAPAVPVAVGGAASPWAPSGPAPLEPAPSSARSAPGDSAGGRDDASAEGAGGFVPPA